jgi:hypothetical protein
MKNTSTRADKEDPIRKYYDESDINYWATIQQIVIEHGLDSKFLLQNNLAFIQRRNLPRLLAHYEMFQKIKDLPGSIVELGVFCGNGLFTWANFLETFCPGDRIRKVFGFDNFEGYKFFTEKDADAEVFTQKHDHKLEVSASMVHRLVKLHNDDNLLRGVERCRLIDGDIVQKVPEFVEQNKGLRLCMLYCDANLYSPTKIGLEYLYPLVVPGGIIAFNAYGQNPWEGEGKALDEFLEEHKIVAKLIRFPFSTIPSCYFIKQ